MENKLLKEITKETQNKYSAKISRTGIHGLEHWTRVYSNSINLIRKILAKKETVKFKRYSKLAALFAFYHDIGRRNDGVCEIHARAGYKLILKDSKYICDAYSVSKEDIEIVATAILIHTSYMPNKNEQNYLISNFKLEDAVFIMLLIDSDRLDIDRVFPEIKLEYITLDASKKIAGHKNSLNK